LTHLKLLRRRLKLTQKQAAELLSISKNTWIRWECGEFKYDEEKVAMLEKLTKQWRPPACWDFQNPKKWDWDVFDAHVRKCKNCQAVVKYLAANI
jgi:DNA-binding XRE family transcriptional regulator